MLKLRTTCQYEQFLCNNQNRHLECIYWQPSCFPTEATVRGFFHIYEISRGTHCPQTMVSDSDSSIQLIYMFIPFAMLSIYNHVNHLPLLKQQFISMLSVHNLCKAISHFGSCPSESFISSYERSDILSVQIQAAKKKKKKHKGCFPE